MRAFDPARTCTARESYAFLPTGLEGLSMMQRKRMSPRLPRSAIAVAGLCLSLASAGVTAAQAPTAAPTPTHPLDPERVAIARQIFDEVGAANLQSMSKALVSNMEQAMLKTVNGIDEDRKQALVNAVSDSVSFIMPKAVDATVDAMAENFDTAQLKDVLSFYKSPTGRMMISKMPVIMQQTSATLMAQLPEMVHQMELRYCAKVTCTSSEQEAFAAISERVKNRTPG